MQKLIRRVQRAYPQIWFACHVEHRTRRAEDGLTDRDAGILEHLDAAPGQRAGELARHLGIGKSSLSAQVKRLIALGLIEQKVADDARERRLVLTRKAETMLIAASPLDAKRLHAVLDVLPPRERQQAVDGIELLARGARTLALRGQKIPRARAQKEATE